MARLIAKIVNVPGYPGAALLLCDGDGNELPGQCETRLNQSCDKAEITVTFFIDGKDIVLEPAMSELRVSPSVMVARLTAVTE